jgi:endoglucanase
MRPEYKDNIGKAAMNGRKVGTIALVLALEVCIRAAAADIVVYDDASHAGYDQDCSFNGVASDFDFANTDPVHTGIHSIRFTPETFDAVSWCFPSVATTADISGIAFWVNGGATGGQNIQFAFAYNGAPVAGASLAELYGQALPANTWVHITAPLDAAPTQYAGSFDKIWFLSNTNAAQPDVYIDDVTLLGRTPNAIFASGFEPASHLRGTNLVGMEMAYFQFEQATGPVADFNYPTYDTRDIDYYAAKHVGAFRFLFSWEGMQSTLNGPIPAAADGNYKIYFDNYKRIVDYATTLGIQVIVEPWQSDAGGGAGGARWRGDLVGSLAVPTLAFADFWGRIATVFKDNPLVSYGLVNEPNSMSTMSWFASAQSAMTAIRATGSTQRIYVPGNGYTAASSWTQNFYDTAATKRSNAYGWLNANGAGQPLSDPSNNIVAEVHCYLDPDAAGSSTDIVSTTIARERLGVAVDEAAAHGYQIYLGEIGMYAGNAIASAAWADFIEYAATHSATLIGYTWWAGGMPGWWDDVSANGGGHFAITPTDGDTFTGDTLNVQMIQSDF